MESMMESPRFNQSGSCKEHLRLEMDSLSQNEEFARVVTAVFMSRLNPTLEEKMHTASLEEEKIPEEQERIRRNHLSSIQRSFPEVNATMWEAYHEMLELCRDKGWNAVLVVPP